MTRTVPPDGAVSGGAARRPIRRARGPTTGSIVFAVVGWVLAVVTAGITMHTMHRDNLDLRRISASLPQVVATLQTEATQRQQTLSERRALLGEAVNGELREQPMLHARQQTLRTRIEELEPQLAPLEEAHRKLRATSAAVSEDTSLVGEGLDQLKTRQTALEQQRGTLVAEYRAGYDAMKAAFEQALARPEPEPLTLFYNAHRHTPFGPAAAFGIGEKFYSRRRNNDAQRMYTELLNRYADSDYAELARNRIEQMRMRLSFDDVTGGGTPVPFRPYKSLSVVEP